LKKILVLGAGRVARPCVAYLQQRSGYSLTIVDTDPENLKRVAGGDRNTVTVEGNALERAGGLIPDCDLVISLLPASLQPEIARQCIAAGKPMINAGYVSTEMQAFHAEAESAGVLILCEMGLDPGIDHMSAMKTIDEIHGQGGKVVEFRSICGALPAPVSNTNPLGYKLSWSPADLIGACVRPARYLMDSKIADLPGDRTLQDYRLKHLGALGWFEEYPNMDALPYVERYRIPEAGTVYRGTIRYIGWCDLINRLVDLGYFDRQKIDVKGMSYLDFTCRLASCKTPKHDDFPAVMSGVIGVPPDSVLIKKMEWLGLFSQDPVPFDTASPRDILAGLFSERLFWQPGEQDIVILRHEYLASFPEKNSLRRYIATLVDYGESDGETSIARTTGLPVGIGADMILRGKLREFAGVHIPVMPEVYDEALEELERNGISFEETVEDTAS